MEPNLDRVLAIQLSVRVRLGEKRMHVRDVLALRPGSLVELPKSADDELDLMVGDKVIGAGAAVKVGENFGLRVSQIGDLEERVRALGGPG